MSDIQNHDETGRKERSAYTRIMNAMLTLEPASRVKVLGAIAIMVRPTVPAEEPAMQDKKGPPPADGPA